VQSVLFWASFKANKNARIVNKSLLLQPATVPHFKRKIAADSENQRRLV